MTDPIQFGKSIAPDNRFSQEFQQREANTSQTTLVQYSRSESSIVTIDSTASTRPVAATNAVESLSPEQAANNILQFIAQRLAALQADGADTETLQSALAQARSGFATGLADSTAILETSGLLNDEQQSRLDRVEARFNAGIEEISKALFGKTNLSDDVAEVTRAQIDNVVQGNATITPATDNSTATTSGELPAPVASIEATQQTNSQQPVASTTIRAELHEVQKFKAVTTQSSKVDGGKNDAGEGREFPAQFINSYQSTRASFKRQESVELQLFTQDGDRITINFSAIQSAKFHFDARSSLGFNGQGFNTPGTQPGFSVDGASRAFSQLFGSTQLNISIEGNLDEGELAALEELFGQLGELFNTFFAGNNAGAVEQALQLEFDSEEIAQFSIDLQLTEKQKIAQRYREVADFSNGPAAGQTENRAGKGLKLGDYLEQIRDVAVSKVKIVEKSLLEQLLSISFAAGNLEVSDADGEVDEADKIAGGLAATNGQLASAANASVATASADTTSDIEELL